MISVRELCLDSVLAVAVILLLTGCSPPSFPGAKANWEEAHVILKNEIDTIEGDFAKTSHIRRFVASHIRLGSNEIHAANVGYHLDRLPVETIYHLFENDCVTAYCGEAAIYLQKVLEDFGYKVHLYDVGFGKATHVCNLVYISEQEKTKIIVQDAYFNHTIVSISDSSAIDFPSIIAQLVLYNSDSLLFLGDSVHGLSLFQRSLDFGHWQLDKVNRTETFKSRNSKAKLLVRSPRDMDMFMSHPELGPRYCQALSNSGHECDVAYLFLYPLPHNDREITEIVQAVKKPLQ